MKSLYRIFEQDDMELGNILICAENDYQAGAEGCKHFDTPYSIIIKDSEFIAETMQIGQEFDPCNNSKILKKTGYRCNGVDERTQCLRCYVYTGTGLLES